MQCKRGHIRSGSRRDRQTEDKINQHVGIDLFEAELPRRGIPEEQWQGQRGDGSGTDGLDERLAHGPEELKDR